MEINYTWRIFQGSLETAQSLNGLNDVVVAINYQRVGVSDNTEYAYAGQAVCPSPSDTDFTAYDDLTKDIIFGWLDALVDTTEINNIIESELLKPKTVSLPLPFDL